jgi:hypothetical protein
VLVVRATGPVAVAARTAWACDACGHLWSEEEATDHCARCGAGPGRWVSAPIGTGPVDVGAPAEGTAPALDLEQEQTRDPASTFAVGPPGVEGISVNPELRVRY